MDELREDKSYHVKLIRLFPAEPKLIWEGRVNFHIQKDPKGRISVLAIKDRTWAEYCYLDLQPDGSYVCEDYQMIISS